MSRSGRLVRRLGRAAILLVLASALGASRPARADAYLDDWHPYQTYWAVGWNIAVPVTSLRAGFVDNTGWLGGSVDIRVGVWGRLALGVDATSNFFDQTFSNLTVERPDYTFTGPAYRRLGAITVLGTAHYYLTQTAVQPFLGIGVGGVWLSSSQRIVNLSTGYYTSGLAVAPEVGLLFNVSARLGLYLSGRYQFNLTTLPGVKNPQWASGVAGFTYYY